MTGPKATASLWPSRMATGVQNLLQDQLYVHLDHQTQEDAGLRFSWRTRSPDGSEMLLPSLLPQTFLWVSPSGLSQKHQRSGKDGEPTLTSPVQGPAAFPAARSAGSNPHPSDSPRLPWASPPANHSQACSKAKRSWMLLGEVCFLEECSKAGRFWGLERKTDSNTLMASSANSKNPLPAPVLPCDAPSLLFSGQSQGEGA